MSVNDHTKFQPDLKPPRLCYKQYHVFAKENVKLWLGLLCLPGIHSSDLRWNIDEFSLRCATTRGSSALEPEPSGEKDISTYWGRVGALITGWGKKKRSWSGESELLFSVNEEKPCCELSSLESLWSAQEVTVWQWENHSRHQALTLPFHLEYAAITSYG